MEYSFQLEGISFGMAELISILENVQGPASTTTRTLCVISNPSLRRRLRRSLQATGMTVEFFDTLSDAANTADGLESPRLLFLDQESRKHADLPHLLQVMDAEGKVIIIGESLADNDFVALMRQQPFDNVIDDAEPDESELVVTSVKLLSGDIFGLDKYLSWGAQLQISEVDGYDNKRDAIAEVAEFAKQVGARRKTLAQIENVTDELLMNAIYDAPAAAGNDPKDASSEAPKAATISYGCDGRYFGISVVDYYGELKKNTILDNLLRARESGGRPREGSSGAGLGIYFVLSSVSRYIANIQEGVKTEVICLFDMRATGREHSSCASSMHIFTAPNHDGAEESGDQD